MKYLIFKVSPESRQSETACKTATGKKPCPLQKKLEWLKKEAKGLICKKIKYYWIECITRSGKKVTLNMKSVPVFIKKILSKNKKPPPAAGAPIP